MQPLDERAAFLDVDEQTLRRRRGLKWSRVADDVLPAWVADMDYPVAPCIAVALQEAVAASDLGYPPADAASGLPDVFARRARQRWGWQVAPHLVSVWPDVVSAARVCVQRLSVPGDRVVVLTPAYPPLLQVVGEVGRVAVEHPLGPDDVVDLCRLAADLRRYRPRLLVLCNPHNPTGRVLTEDELRGIATLAAERDVLLVSDEIHADLVLEGRHVPVARLDDAAGRTVTLTSASKSHNISGVRCALAVAGSEQVATAMAAGPPGPRPPVGSLGVVATLAAWTPEGDAWLEACLGVLTSNRNRVTERLADPALGIGLRRPEATYLAWLDCRSLDLPYEPAGWFLHEARVALSAGSPFGRAGDGFARLNFATTPALLEQVLDRMTQALRRRAQRTRRPARTTARTSTSVLRSSSGLPPTASRSAS